MKNHIFLIGFMGCGKSTAAESLSLCLHLPHIEMDEQIVSEQGMPITEIFEKYGETAFRDMETDLLRRICNLEGAIVSCGGGVVLREENVVMMKASGMIVLLTARPETILERVKHSRKRPVLNGHMNVEYIAELMEKRRRFYENAADAVIATDDKKTKQICEEIEREMKNNRSGQTDFFYI